MMEDNNNIKFLLAYIRKIQINTDKDEVLAINKISLLIIATIGKKDINVSIKIL